MLRFYSCQFRFHFLPVHPHGAEDDPVDGPLLVYGSDAPELGRLLAEHPGWAEPLHPGLPYRVGEVVWAARHELARTVEDVLARRTAPVPGRPPPKPGRRAPGGRPAGRRAGLRPGLAQCASALSPASWLEPL